LIPTLDASSHRILKQPVSSFQPTEMANPVISLLVSVLKYGPEGSRFGVLGNACSRHNK
jgi:hypothetical protein